MGQGAVAWLCAGVGEEGVQAPILGWEGDAGCWQVWEDGWLEGNTVAAAAADAWQHCPTIIVVSLVPAVTEASVRILRLLPCAAVIASAFVGCYT